MKRFFVFICASTVVMTVFGFDVRCNFGAQCIATQGTKIPSGKVIDMMRDCDDFTRNDIGRYALKLSLQEVLQKTNGKAMHPLNVANYAFGQLYDSSLRFDRKQNLEETKYSEIKRSCFELERDFNDRSKWEN